MNIITAGIVDYGMGNHASVAQSLRDLQFRVRISCDPMELGLVDILILPGVGAFPSAMRALKERGLVEFLRAQGAGGRPIVGICLGMQLLATASQEYRYTRGLDLIPGQVVPVGSAKWHIGWNTIRCVRPDPYLSPSDGHCFYFNHSFSYQGPTQYILALTPHETSLVAAIRKGKVVGLQFHPEKSQTAGKILLRNVVAGLCSA